MNHIFNPFLKKKVADLEVNDLLCLQEKQICEGWYVEYKRDIPKGSNNKFDNIKIAKSISSFANTKGGWIFWGITCENTNFPNAINGIDLQDYRNIEDQISQIINSNVSPKPIYGIKIIALPNGKDVIAIQVDPSPEPPYITSQGIIYQRENNESKPIKDRYIIEKLNEKTELYRKSIENFSTFDLTMSKAQDGANQTFLELYLFPTPFGGFQFENFRTSDFFNKIAYRFYDNMTIALEQEARIVGVNKATLNLGFNSIYNNGSSIIIRSLLEENIIDKTTTIELFEDGNIKVSIPLNEFQGFNPPRKYDESQVLNYLLDKYSPYEVKERYNVGMFSRNLSDRQPPVKERSNSDFFTFFRLIDGADILVKLMIIIRKYKDVLNDNGFDLNEKIGMRAKLTNCWRKFVFFDDIDYLEKIKLFNVPVSPKDEIEMPKFINGSYNDLNLQSDNIAFEIGKIVLQGIGLPDADGINLTKIVFQELTRIIQSPE